MESNLVRITNNSENAIIILNHRNRSRRVLEAGKYTEVLAINDTEARYYIETYGGILGVSVELNPYDVKTVSNRLGMLTSNNNVPYITSGYIQVIDDKEEIDKTITTTTVTADEDNTVVTTVTQGDNEVNSEEVSTDNTDNETEDPFKDETLETSIISDDIAKNDEEIHDDIIEDETENNDEETSSDEVRTSRRGRRRKED